MENQFPFTAEPFATKRSDGKVEVCLTTYKSWLPMFYLLPKEKEKHTLLSYYSRNGKAGKDAKMIPS